jgi:2-C-methyl-D-erythritol 4-phosphate cytidylyltransferase
MNGLRFIMEADPDCEWVLVHDAARPCLSAAALHDLIELGLTSMAGAILAIPVSDTLKVANESGYINQTVDRSCYWSAQTPQLFRIHQLAANMESALSQGEQPTDEAAAMEAAGVHPLLVQGVASNIKITGPDDMAMAEFILQRQAVAE